MNTQHKLKDPFRYVIPPLLDIDFDLNSHEIYILTAPSRELLDDNWYSIEFARKSNREHHAQKPTQFENITGL